MLYSYRKSSNILRPSQLSDDDSVQSGLIAYTPVRESLRTSGVFFSLSSMGCIGVDFHRLMSLLTSFQELNCGGDTGIACESTQLQSLGALKDIKDSITKPFDVQDCSPSTQCYQDKEKSVLDDINKYFNHIPTGVLDLQTILKNTYLNPFAKSTALTCFSYSLAPIKFEFYSIDGKKAVYEQQLPGELFVF